MPVNWPVVNAGEPELADGEVGFSGDSEQAEVRRAARMKATDEKRMFFTSLIYSNRHAGREQAEKTSFARSLPCAGDTQV
jgi:hypothetical protein